MKRYTPYLFAAILLLILCLAPRLFSSYLLGLLIITLIYGIFTMSLNILTGYAGLPSLGHAMFKRYRSKQDISKPPDDMGMACQRDIH